MPELPELQALAEGLTAALAGRAIEGVRVNHPATLKTAVPPLEDLTGRAIARVWRRGKLLGVEAEGCLALVIHLMQAGRLGIADAPRGRPGRQAAIDLDVGERPGAAPARAVHEAPRVGPPARRRRAGRPPAAHAPGAGADRPRPGGLARGDGAGRGAAHRPARRAPGGRHRARLRQRHHVGRPPGPLRAHRRPSGDDDLDRLARAADAVLGQALERARERITTDLPNREARVTAVHGHVGEPCLRCGTLLEHVAFEEYDLVYCPACQTAGRVYRDRRMSRFLHVSEPRWTLLYDGDCSFCRVCTALTLVKDRRRRLAPLPLRDPAAPALLPGRDRARPHGLVAPGGTRRLHVGSGGAALAPLLRLLPGGGPAAAVAERFPGAMDRGYRFVVRHRRAFGRWILPAWRRWADRRIAISQGL